MKVQPSRVIALMLAACLPLGGCVPLLLGGAAGGAGYYAGKKGDDPREAARMAKEDREAKRMEAKRTAEQQRVDQQLSQQLNQRYLGGELTRVLAVNSTVQEGIVTLTGTVPSPKVAERAIAIAQATPGVRQVVSRLTILPAPGAAAAAGGMMAAQPQLMQPQPVQGQMMQAVPPAAMAAQPQPMQQQPMMRESAATPYIPPQTTTSMEPSSNAVPNTPPPGPAPVYTIPGTEPALDSGE